MDNIENLEEKLIFYESYHHNFYNKLVHIFFVPILLYTGIAIVDDISNYAAIIGTLFYSWYYINLDKVGGLSYSVILYIMYYYRDLITISEAFSLHIISWIAQILSHKYLEGRAPALMDSFFTSITIAPLYIWLELLSWFGYKTLFIDNIYIQGGKKLEKIE
jgi:2-hydroxy fatty acid dioxygenase